MKFLCSLLLILEVAAAAGSIRGLLDGKSVIASSVFSHQRLLQSVAADCAQADNDPLCGGKRSMGSGSGSRILGSKRTMRSSTTMGCKMASAMMSNAPTPNPTPARVKPTAVPSSSKFLAKLKPLLSSESLTALNDPDMPQSRSFQWLLQRSNFEAWPFHRNVQRYAMATIYFATEGRSWSNGSTTWLTNASECMWSQGSSTSDICDENGTLLILKQNENELKGKIPDEIGLLSALTVVDLSANQLTGTLPSKLGSMTALTLLGLTYNWFTGTVPSQLGALTALENLYLDTNSFKGTVPSELGSLTALTALGLSYNSFKGTVPSELGSLTALTMLALFVNFFTEAVPLELGSLTALTYVALSSNSFNGTVPSQLGSLTALKELSLFSNSFTGTVPSELGSLTALTYLDLSSNSFDGTVPSQLGALTALKNLDLYDNVGLNGTVPAKLCNLGNTVEIKVDCKPGPQCSCCICWEP